MAAAGWIEAFLEMMAVERAAARNTLTAYAKDLADAGALGLGMLLISLFSAWGFGRFNGGNRPEQG